jgi:hypothetical protein
MTEAEAEVIVLDLYIFQTHSTFIFRIGSSVCPLCHD